MSLAPRRQVVASLAGCFALLSLIAWSSSGVAQERPVSPTEREADSRQGRNLADREAGPTLAVVDDEADDEDDRDEDAYGDDEEDDDRDEDAGDEDAYEDGDEEADSEDEESGDEDAYGDEDSNDEEDEDEEGDDDDDEHEIGGGPSVTNYVVRLGAGVGLQAGLAGDNGRLTAGLNLVFELDSLRIFGEGGWLTGAEPGSGTSGFYLGGWWAGLGAGYKLTLIEPGILGLYSEAGAIFQSLIDCQACGPDDRRFAFGVDVEAGGFFHNGNSQVHLAATASTSSAIGIAIGVVARWEYKLFGFSR